METNDSPNRVYEPTLDSVKQHQVPPWYHDAKFGIFIHWSLSSIPAFAPAGSQDIVEIIKTGGWKAQYKNYPTRPIIEGKEQCLINIFGRFG